MEEIKKSKVETAKENSRQLRGTLAEALAKDSASFSPDDVQVLKFHGAYPQDDRDLRQTRIKEGKPKHFYFMVRLKIPGGVLTAEQYLACDDIATRHANDTLRITTRQDFQLHGVLKKNLKETVRNINASLLTTLGACGDLERNVMTCPAPAADRRKAEIETFARQISDRLLPKTRAYHEIWLSGEKIEEVGKAEAEEPLYGKAYLPRKFKSAIGFSEDNCVEVHTQDIGMVAIPDEKGDLKGFDVLVGGGMGMTHKRPETFPRLADLLTFVPKEDIVKLCAAIVLVQRDFGDREKRSRARMKYLIHDRGLPWFKGEVEKRFGKSLPPPLPLPELAIEDHLGWHAQGDGTHFLGISIENGRIQDAGGRRYKTGLREAVSRYRPGVRLTPHQNILLTDIPEEKREEVEAFLKSFGIDREHDISNAERFSMACPALPTCGLAITDSERHMPGVVDRLELVLKYLGLENEKIMIRMTGCPNGCTRPYVGELGFVGKSVRSYNIYVGGNFQCTRLHKLYAEDVPKDDLVKTVTPLFVCFKKERQSGERFGDFCYRKGIEALKSFAAQNPTLP